MKKIILSIACLGVLQLSAQEIAVEKVEQHIRFLSADELKGRGTGTDGEQQAAFYIAEQMESLGLKPKGGGKTKDRWGAYFQPFEFRNKAATNGDTVGMARNVVGYLDNGAEYTIVIGAHYDHLGEGHQGSSLEANPGGFIHNGADDNASGTAGVIELARYFATNADTEKVNFLFIAFSGEELGLLGSKFYAEHPTIDLKSVTAMINMDMIGRLDENKGLAISGYGTSPSWDPILKEAAGADLKYNTDSSGVGPSDHTSFYLKDIPVLHFFTGAHADYHKPSDDMEKINYAGEVQVLGMIARTVSAVAEQAPLKFAKTRTPAQSGHQYKVSMGVMPDYSFKGPGMRIDGVTEGKPAQKAGMQKGDIILRVGEYPVNDVMSYMEVLSKQQKGVTVKVKIQRGKKKKTLKVTF